MELKHGIIRGCIEGISTRGSDSSCESEKTGTTDDRRLTILIKYWVAAKKSHSAADIFFNSENQVHGYKITCFLQRRRPIHPLSPAQLF
ncbi:hypothetical protein HYC85_030448 [Camellia sinensis]|uniref:Uncharacterized protein n=1 Tax=Camellia sinensis TaxID=4442 RepID=A0A7J7G1F4_CAMSI|nr:hypothetical protein HYC85_030448 [Camellia sinensis]